MRFSGIVLSVVFASSAFAQGSNLLNQEVKTVSKGASQIYKVYKILTDNVGLKNQAGHTMAAAVLTRCLGPSADEGRYQKVIGDWNDILNLLKQSSHRTVANGASQLTPQMTYAAATLACKKGKRSASEMAGLLNSAYGALLADGWVDWLPNAVAAAELVTDESPEL